MWQAIYMICAASITVSGLVLTYKVWPGRANLIGSTRDQVGPFLRAEIPLGISHPNAVSPMTLCRRFAVSVCVDMGFESEYCWLCIALTLHVLYLRMISLKMSFGLYGAISDSV